MVILVLLGNVRAAIIVTLTDSLSCAWGKGTSCVASNRWVES